MEARGYQATVTPLRKFSETPEKLESNPFVLGENRSTDPTRNSNVQHEWFSVLFEVSVLNCRRTDMRRRRCHQCTQLLAGMTANSISAPACSEVPFRAGYERRLKSSPSSPHRFRFLRIKYQRAMLLCKDQSSRWSHCPLFNELHAVLWEDPLPSEVPLTPSQIARRKFSVGIRVFQAPEASIPSQSVLSFAEKKENRASEPSTNEEKDEGPGPPSVIQLEPTRQPQGSEFTAYLAKLVDGLSKSLKDRAMQHILGYVFSFRKKIRLSKALTDFAAS